MYMRPASRHRYAPSATNPCEMTTPTTSGSQLRASRLTVKIELHKKDNIHRRRPGMFLLKCHTA